MFTLSFHQTVSAKKAGIFVSFTVFLVPRKSYVAHRRHSIIVFMESKPTESQMLCTDHSLQPNLQVNVGL